MGQRNSPADFAPTVEDFREMLTRGNDVDTNFAGSRFELFLPNLDASCKFLNYLEITK